LRPCRTRIALISFGTLKASAERNRRDAKDKKDWKTPPDTPNIFHSIVAPRHNLQTEQLKFDPNIETFNRTWRHWFQASRNPAGRYLDGPTGEGLMQGSWSEPAATIRY
jgi:hypothetical protein